ncbi:JmjC domain-containing protein [Abyssogena phaseoliformis symbiont]|uniref:JmjC domain-containing protein n=1 Tax=Abyssogena phaseoliformis symbiont TaxID=596095 RepID=UPI003CC9D211
MKCTNSSSNSILYHVGDLTISYATLGGSVGPHMNYYDVFLLQSSGQTSLVY